MKKTILFSAIVLAGIYSFAEDSAQTADFAKKKEMALKMSDTFLQAAQDLKTCVQAATDNKAIKKCHEDFHAKKAQFRKEHASSMHEEMIDEKIKKLQEKKAELESKKKTH